LEIEVVVHLFVEEQAMFVEQVGADKQLADGVADMAVNVMDMIEDMDGRIGNTVETVSIDFVVGFHAAMA